MACRRTLVLPYTLQCNLLLLYITLLGLHPRCVLGVLFCVQESVLKITWPSIQNRDGVSRVIGCRNIHADTVSIVSLHSVQTHDTQGNVYCLMMYCLSSRFSGEQFDVQVPGDALQRPARSSPLRRLHPVRRPTENHVRSVSSAVFALTQSGVDLS